MATIALKAPVGIHPRGSAGKTVRNNFDDCELVREMLFANGIEDVGHGRCDKTLINAILKFQRRILKKDSVDGVVDPGGTTFRKLLPGYRRWLKTPAKNPDADIDGNAGDKADSAKQKLNVLRFGNKDYALTDDELKKFQKEYFGKFQIGVRNLERLVAEAKWLWKYYDDCATARNGVVQALVYYSVRLTVTFPDKKVIDEAERAVASLGAAVKAKNFNKTAAAFKPAQDACERAWYEMNRVRNELNGSANSVKWGLEQTSSWISAYVGSYVGARIGGVKGAAAGAGAVAALFETAKQISMWANGLSKGFPHAMKEIQHQAWTNALVAGSVAKVSDKVIGSLGPTLAKTLGKRLGAAYGKQLTRVVEQYARGPLRVHLETIVGKLLTDELQAALKAKKKINGAQLHATLTAAATKAATARLSGSLLPAISGFVADWPKTCRETVEREHLAWMIRHITYASPLTRAQTEDVMTVCMIRSKLYEEVGTKAAFAKLGAGSSKGDLLHIASEAVKSDPKIKKLCWTLVEYALREMEKRGTWVRNPHKR